MELGQHCLDFVVCRVPESLQKRDAFPESLRLAFVVFHRLTPGECPEADFRMDLADDPPRFRIVVQQLVDLFALAEDRERLFAEAPAGRVPTAALGVLVVNRVEHGPGRGWEHTARTTTAEFTASNSIALSPAGPVRESNGNVDEDTSRLAGLSYQRTEMSDHSPPGCSRWLQRNEEPACGASIDADCQDLRGVVVRQSRLA